MKFHNLTICNLNSLAGEQTLDFDAITQGAGMFLIHGPTGAGKSTLLDAICLALFGKTPRLGDSGMSTLEGIDEGASDDNAVRVMTQGTARASASLELSVADEQGTRARYRARWEVWRSHDRADGKFQKPRRSLEVYEGGAWQMLVESQQQLPLAEPFARMLRGLTFVDFQRTILLAQFKFREFLEADVKARTAILERMTDSERFRQIGRRVAAEHRRADETLQQCKAGLDGLVMLAAGERESLVAALGASREAAEQARVELLQIDEARTWLTSLAWALERQAEAEARRSAVEERRRQAQTQLAALAEDERVAPARGQLVALQAAEATQARHDALLGASRSDEASALAGEAVARDAHEQASAALALVSAGRDAGLPAIEQAAEAWRAARSAEADAARVQGAADEAAGAVTVRRDALAALTRRGEEAAAALADCERRYALIPAADRVWEAAGGVADLSLQLERSCEVAARMEAERNSEAQRSAAHTAERPAHAARLDTAARAAAEAGEGLRTLEATLGATTAGLPLEAALAQAETSREAADASLALLDGLARAIAQRAKAAEALDVATHKAREAEASLAQATEEESRTRGDAAGREVDLAELRAHLQTLDALLAVLDHRDILREGEPCPVCGSEEHPFVRYPERAPELEEERARREALSARVDEAAQRAREAAHRAQASAISRAEAAARLAERSHEVEARRAAHAAAVALCAEAAAEAGADAHMAEDSELVARRRADAEQARAAAQQHLARIRALEGQLRASRETAQAASRAEADVERELARFEEEGRLIEARLAGLAEQARARGEEAGEVGARLAARLAELSVDAGDGRPDALVEGARQVAARAEQVRSLRAEREAAAQAVDALKPALAEARVLCAEAEAAQGRTAEEALTAAARAAEALATARAQLGGADPDARRAALDAALASHQRAESAARDALATATTARAEAATLAGAYSRAAAEAAERADEARGALARALAALGLGSAEELAARTLGDEARRAAAELREQLARESQEAGALFEKAALEVAALSAAPPTGELPGPDAAAIAARLAALAAAREAAEVARGQAQQEVGAREQSLAADDRARAEAAGREEALAAAQADADHWQTVHDLVGTSDGERFATVVQALHLQQVLVYANENLARFMARYELEQVIHHQHGPVLDFRVVDKHQQGAPRSIRSLSGGESFIVSLALALGLSAMRSSRLRVETLLIDEGFGALDPASLAIAQQALQSLQGVLGVQIGIISHVATLKEHIGAQIYVEPVGAGRARVRVGAGPG